MLSTGAFHLHGFLLRTTLMIVFVVSIKVFKLYVVVPTWLGPNGARFIPSKTKSSQLALTWTLLVAPDLPRGSDCSYFWEDSKFYPFQLALIIDPNGIGSFDHVKSVMQVVLMEMHLVILDLHWWWQGLRIFLGGFQTLWIWQQSRRPKWTWFISQVSNAATLDVNVSGCSRLALMAATSAISAKILTY